MLDSNTIYLLLVLAKLIIIAQILSLLRHVIKHSRMIYSDELDGYFVGLGVVGGEEELPVGTG